MGVFVGVGVKVSIVVGDTVRVLVRVGVVIFFTLDKNPGNKSLNPFCKKLTILVIIYLIYTVSVGVFVLVRVFVGV